MAGPQPKFTVLAEIDGATGFFFGRKASGAYLVDQNDIDSSDSDSSDDDAMVGNDWDEVAQGDEQLDIWAVSGVHRTFAKESVSGAEFASTSTPLTSFLYAAKGIADGRNWLVGFNDDASIVNVFSQGAEGCFPVPSPSQDFLSSIELGSITIFLEFPNNPELTDESSIYSVWEFMHLMRGRHSIL